MQSAKKISNNVVLLTALIVFAVIWSLLAISPTSRTDWWLENILIFVAFVILLISYRFFRLSTFSYVLILIFLTLHSYGAHYAYTNSPVDHWLKDLFHLKRNLYDRVVHLGYGLLMSFPVYEVIRRFVRVKGVWAYLISSAFIISLGALYEIGEMLVGFMVNPKTSAKFVGLQGDKWDTQKDLIMSSSGSIAIMIVSGIIRGWIKKK